MAAVAATGGTSHAGRDARRRRILERGPDRLALITGRIQSLPPEPQQSRSPRTPPTQTPADSARHDDVTPASSLPNQESGWEPSQRSTSDDTVRPLPGDNDKRRSITTGAAALLGVQEELSQISSSTRSFSPDHQREQQSHRSLFTTGQISSAVAASQNIRMWCSVAVAILVIVSYVGFPYLGSRIIRGLLTFRPVYLLFLTNISVVLAQLLLGTQGAELKTRRSRAPVLGGNGLVDQLGKALETSFLLQKIFVALFLDFSIYAVVLVCGLSLVRILGW